MKILAFAALVAAAVMSIGDGGFAHAAGAAMATLATM